MVDGGTLKFGRTYVRFGGGVDAPERHQLCRRNGQPWLCGDHAAASLASLIDGRVVPCEDLGRDYHKRVLGNCRADSTNLNSEMVRWAWTLDRLHYSEGRCAPEQK